jgi:hypothetical protein
MSSETGPILGDFNVATGAFAPALEFTWAVHLWQPMA